MIPAAIPPMVRRRFVNAKEELQYESADLCPRRAPIIKGHKVADSVRFLVVPASLEIYKQALKEGLIDIFMDAGAIVMNPNCSVCWGSCQGVIGENEVLISTGTRNFKGRAGHPSSKVYLGSAATVTASAIAGKIALAEDIH